MLFYTYLISISVGVLRVKFKRNSQTHRGEQIKTHFIPARVFYLFPGVPFRDMHVQYHMAVQPHGEHTWYR